MDNYLLSINEYLEGDGWANEKHEVFETLIKLVSFVKCEYPQMEKNHKLYKFLYHRWIQIDFVGFGKKGHHFVTLSVKMLD